MSPESAEHQQIKKIVLDKLKMTYGAGLIEYADSGHRNDITIVTNDGIKIFIENAWTSTRHNFNRDLTIFHRSDAKVNILIVNPGFLEKEDVVRDYEKTKMSERERGVAISDMIDGFRILSDPDYVDQDFGRMVNGLVEEARRIQSDWERSQQAISKSLLKHSRTILLTRSDYQGLEDWAPANLMENLIRLRDREIEVSCLMQHFKTGYHDELWTPLMEYKKLIEHYGGPVVPYPPRFQEAIGGYGKGLREAFERIPEKDQKRLLELKKRFLDSLDGVIFGVKNDKPLRGRCDYCPNR